MGEDNEVLSHEEMWDDSELIDSWNQALDEYKKYHSILAKGGSIKDLENAVASSSTEADTKPNPEHVKVQETPSGESKRPESGTTPSLASAGPPGLPPQALLGTIRDESLKKLLMAWYYAGYYTGLFEGQQQADQATQQPDSKGQTS